MKFMKKSLIIKLVVNGQSGIIQGLFHKNNIFSFSQVVNCITLVTSKSFVYSFYDLFQLVRSFSLTKDRKFCSPRKMEGFITFAFTDVYIILKKDRIFSSISYRNVQKLLIDFIFIQNIGISSVFIFMTLTFNYNYQLS